MVGRMGKKQLDKVRWDFTEYLASRWKIQRSRGRTRATFPDWWNGQGPHEHGKVRRLYDLWRATHWDPAHQPVWTAKGWMTRSRARGLRKEARPSKTGYIGVQPKGNRFIALLKILGKTKYLGSAETAEEAARIRDKMARSVFGPTALLNFPS